MVEMLRWGCSLRCNVLWWWSGHCQTAAISAVLHNCVRKSQKQLSQPSTTSHKLTCSYSPVTSKNTVLLSGLLLPDIRHMRWWSSGSGQSESIAADREIGSNLYLANLSELGSLFVTIQSITVQLTVTFMLYHYSLARDTNIKPLWTFLLCIF